MTIIRKEKRRKEKGVREEKRDVPLAIVHGRDHGGGGGDAPSFARRHIL